MKKKNKVITKKIQKEKIKLQKRLPVIQSKDTIQIKFVKREKVLFQWNKKQKAN